MRWRTVVTGSNGSIQAHGTCEYVPSDESQFTFWPDLDNLPDTVKLDDLTIKLQDGSIAQLDHKLLKFNLQGPNETRVPVFRLRLAQEAKADKTTQ